MKHLSEVEVKFTPRPDTFPHNPSIPFPRLSTDIGSFTVGASFAEYPPKLCCNWATAQHEPLPHFCEPKHHILNRELGARLSQSKQILLLDFPSFLKYLFH